MPSYRYALVNRPADFSTLPPRLEYLHCGRPAKGLPHHDVARHGYIETHEPLTTAQVKAYELALMLDGDETDALAAQVAGDFEEYRDEYLDMDSEELALAIFGRLNHFTEGRISIGDLNDFTARVSRHLTAMKDRK